MRHKVWLTEQFRFSVRGKNTQQFLNIAASRDIHLAHLCRIKNGVTAQGAGADYVRLSKLAEEGGWEFSVQSRRGPGRFAERLLARPGILAGTILFALLLQGMGGFVWTIQFGNLQGEAQQEMRELLADCRIYEGAVLTSQTLEEAQVRALQQSETFGWVSLNFADGCLSVENTEAEYQTIREKAPLKPLVARIGGKIVAVESESGFAVVEPGQEVEPGQLLVDVVRLDRDGNEISQGAGGKILAQCQQTYSEFQPYEVSAKVLDGRSRIQDTVHLFGMAWKLAENDESVQGVSRTEWQPFQIGRLSLPGCVCRETLWLQSEKTIQYSEKQAENLARRACRRKLYEDFPDAEIESQLCEVEVQESGVTCTITYRFRANIATTEP